MPDAQRTLVKSPPELWAEVSDPASLARHLGEFGAIRITRTEPETTVAWEGDRVRGTVELEPSGWGTKVKLTAEPEPEPVAAAEPVTVTVAEPVAEPEPEPAVRRSWFARFFRRRAVAVAPEPVAVAEPAPVALVEPEPEPATAPEPVDHEALLSGVLDALGSAHHRPFSRG